MVQSLLLCVCAERGQNGIISEFHHQLIGFGILWQYMHRSLDFRHHLFVLAVSDIGISITLPEEALYQGLNFGWQKTLFKLIIISTIFSQEIISKLQNFLHKFGAIDSTAMAIHWSFSCLNIFDTAYPNIKPKIPSEYRSGSI